MACALQTPAHLSLQHLLLASRREKSHRVLDMEEPRKKAEDCEKAKSG